MKKVSFDFDFTLDNKHVQEYVKKLILQNFEVHIVTSRPSKWIQRWKVKEKPLTTWYNEDLYEISDMLGIKRENIHFMFNVQKYKFFIDKDFIFHLDDDYTEVYEINKYTKTIGISYDGIDWKTKCDNLLK